MFRGITTLLGLLFIISGCGLMGSRDKSPNPQTPQTPPMPSYDVSYEPGNNAPRQRILVLPFINEKIGQGAEGLDEARSIVIRDLIRSKKIIVVNPSDFPEDVAKYMTEEGDYNLEALAQKAQGIGISAVLEGKVLSIKAVRKGEPIGIVRSIKADVTTQVRLRMVATTNARQVMEETKTATAESQSTRVLKRAYSDRNLVNDPKLSRASLIKAFRMTLPAVFKNLDKLSWEGRVALINGEKIYVNAGRLSGIQIGDILKVLEEGKEVYDPETGRYIGTAPGRMKGTVEIVSYFGKDGAIGIVHSGSGFKENDRVEIY